MIRSLYRGDPEIGRHGSVHENIAPGDDDDTFSSSIDGKPYSSLAPNPVQTSTLDRPYKEGDITPMVTSSSIPSPSTTLASSGFVVVTSVAAAPITHDGDRDNFKTSWLAAIILPTLAVVILAAFVFVCLRRRRRQQMADFVRNHELKYTEARESPRESYTTTHRSQNLPDLVVLTPIQPTFNASYYTGLDTSERISIQTNRNPFSDGISYLDEPPPPYRPRSTELYRASSDYRLNNITEHIPSEAQYMAPSEQRPISPFAHLNDDTISIISQPTTSHNRRQDDELSAVSDLSYQEAPVTAHNAV